MTDETPMECNLCGQEPCVCGVPRPLTAEQQRTLDALREAHAMTTTDKGKAAAAAAVFRAAADELNALGMAVESAKARAEADRLDPPAHKTVTWARDMADPNEYRVNDHGDIVFRRRGSSRREVVLQSRDVLNAVVLPLLADAPDGPIPDETVEKACMAMFRDWNEIGATYQTHFRSLQRAALEAARGLPGMAVVRAGKPPEVLRWEVWNGVNDVVATCATRETAYEFAREFHKGVAMRVVAIIADPGEGTA